MKMLSCLGLLLLMSCGKTEEQKHVTFKVRGQVVSVHTANRTVTISHEEIPNFMAAMTMNFKVKDTTLLRGITEGDSILANLVVSKSESWLDAISVAAKGKPETLTPGTSISRLFRKGEPLPDVEFTNQDDKRFRLSSLRGKVVALTFIYTRCPLPDYCIRMSNYFARIERTLKKNASMDGKWHLLSITFDTKHDTPEILRKYGRTYEADFSRWSFVTGTEETIRKLTGGFDMIIMNSEGGLIDHNLMTALVDTKGNLVETFDSNQWRPEDVAGRIAEIAKP